MSINGWMDKDVVGYYSAIKKEWCNAIYNDMEESKDCHIEWSRSDKKDKHHVISLICGI